MKKLKMIYKWILISVLIQAAVLSYINFIYLPNRGTVRATMYEAEAAAIKGRSFKLPDEAQNITVSFDGLYVAYRRGNDLVIADIDKRKTIKTLSSTSGVFTYFRWLPDREMLIYSAKEPGGKKGQVLVSTYDIGPDIERSYPNIENLPEGSEIIDIELSPLTNIVYPMIKTSETRARIYKFDIMDNLKLVMKTGISTVIKETMYTDNLIYQTSDGIIRIRNGKTGGISQIPAKEAKLLLAADDNDFVYAAVTDDNGKLTAIFSGKLEKKAEEWKTVKLEQPLSATDVFITPEGGMYAADKQENKIHAIKGSGVTGYQGDLLTVLDSYVVSMDGNKLLLKVLE